MAITLPCSEELVVMGEMGSKVFKEDLQNCAWLQFRYGDKLANCLERIFFDVANCHASCG